MIGFAVLLLAIPVGSATSTPSPIPTPGPTASPWMPRRPPTPKVLNLAESTPIPGSTSLSDVASRLRLKRSGDGPIMISGHGLRSTARRSPAPGTSLALELGEIEVVTYKKAAGIETYIVAKDMSGTEVPVDGYYTFTIRARGLRVVDIRCPWGAPGCGREERFEQDVYFGDGALAADDFHTVTVGLGAFAHPRLLRSFGVIPFGEMTIGPVNSLDLIVTVIVEPNGRLPLTSSTTVVVR